MKRGFIAAIVIALVMPITASAQPVDLDRIAAETKWRTLSRQLCITADTFFGYNEAGERVEEVLLNHLGITRDTPGYRDHIVAFWNANSAKLICEYPASKKPYARVPQHFTKRVVDLRMANQIFYEFLLDDSETWQVDVNAVEMVDGRGETLLDYLNDILADPSREVNYDYDEIRELREYIVEEYGATSARK